jgi:hypothetical protein
MADSQSGLITATIEAATGKIVAVRSVDDEGEASDLTTDRRAKLAKESGGATLEDLFEQAFEAGIACVLGDSPEDADAIEAESEEDAVLRREILRPMIEKSAARRLMRQEVLGRAIVGTLIQKAARGYETAARSRPQSTS